MHNNIQIFSSDYRKNIQWDLPYIRLGNYQSDAVFQITGDKIKQTLYTDASQLLWIYDHYNEIGNPEFIGFCQYRRFFTNKSQNALIQFENRDGVNIALSPKQQLDIIEANDVDGLIPYPFMEDFYTKDLYKPINERKKFNSLDEYFYLSLNDQNLGVTLDQIHFVLTKLYENSFDDFKIHIKNSYNNFPVHFCSIFTLKEKYFKIWGNLQKKTLEQFIHYCGNSINQMNCRIVGYIAERLSSCILYAFLADCHWRFCTGRRILCNRSSEYIFCRTCQPKR